MGVTEKDIAAVFAIGKEGHESGAAILRALRDRLPGLRVSQCPASDVNDEPYRSGEIFDLHLLDTRDHCWKMTSDIEVATGVLLAMHRSSS